MSSLAVLKSALSLVEARDLEGFLAMLSDDCVIMKDNGEVVAKGPAQLRDFYTPVFADQKEMKIHLEHEFETGSIVAVREVNQDVAIDGAVQDFSTVWIYRIVSGKIAYMHVFTPDASSEEAMQAFM
jgi:hypothetical protein